MAGKNMFNDKDSMDISELASLNDDISPELIEQLQQKLVLDAQSLSDKPFNENDDTTLFEEPGREIKEPEAPKPKPINLDANFDDNFIKKYKAKLNKQAQEAPAKPEESVSISNVAFSEEPEHEPIEQVSNGNITEKKLTQEQKNYNDSLDFLDGNVKYSKYVIYIDPQNVDFIEGLTVKERKNLINKILREQDDIAITKHRFRMVQTVIKHAIVAIVTVVISIPVIYYTINASLEASINNYRRSQTNFKVLYKEKGKISKKQNHH